MAYDDTEKRTFDITVPFMYISGVAERYFTAHGGPLEDSFRALQEIPVARDVRALCMLRSAVMAEPGPVSFGLTKGGKLLSGMADILPEDADGALPWLIGRGIPVDAPGKGVQDHVILLDDEVEARIDAARGIFPAWVEWECIKDLLVLPGDKKRTSGSAMAAFEGSGRYDYPYGTWISCAGKPERMMLKDDRTFLTAVYGMRGEEAPSMDEGAIDRADAEASLAAFIAAHEKTLLAVDGENNDPVMLASLLRMADGAAGVVVADTGDGSAAWRMLEACGIAEERGAEHFTVPSTSGYKNQADMALTACVSRKVYTEGYDSVVLASSDCDFMALMSSLGDTDFLVLADRDKCGAAMKKGLRESMRKYCWLNGFDGEDERELKSLALNSRVEEAVSGLNGVSLYRMLRDAEEDLRIELPPEDEAGILRGIADRLTVRVNGAWDASIALEEGPEAAGPDG